MDKIDRFQQLHRIFTVHRRPVPISTLARKLECTERTVRRLLDQMRDYLAAPIEYSPTGKGWHYVQIPGEHFELPGLWLTSDELQSLTILLHVLENFGNGMLNAELAVVQRQIDKLLTARGISPGAFADRIRVLPLANRTVPPRTIGLVGEALLRRRRLRVRYTSFKRERSERTISPQTLVYYRENWYLDAWCHLRGGLRTFSLARIDYLHVLDDSALNVEEERLREHFGGSYGMFAGQPRHTACLRFLPGIAHEVALQQWHPEQEGHWEGNDYVLSFPYGDSTELASDILRHIPNVIVERPESLRELVRERLSQGMALYG